MDEHDKSKNVGTTFLRWLGRFIIMAIVLAIVSYVTPGFTIVGLWSFVLAALVICLLDFFIELLLKVDVAPFVKGLKGFVITVIILYLTQFVVPNMSVSILGAIIAAIVIGILDAIFPTRIM